MPTNSNPVLALFRRCPSRKPQRHTLHHRRMLSPTRLEPFAYLRDLLTRLPTLTNWQIKDVTPQAWAKAKIVPGLKVA